MCESRNFLVFLIVLILNVCTLFIRIFDTHLSSLKSGLIGVQNKCCQKKGHFFAKNMHFRSAMWSGYDFLHQVHMFEPRLIL